MSDHYARRAAEILSDEVWHEAVKTARESLKDQWSQATTPQQREALWHKYAAVDEVSRALRRIRDKGKAHKTEQS